jgi:hypothetical protein
VCPVPFKIIELDQGTMSIVSVVVDGEPMKTFADATPGPKSVMRFG